MWRRNNPPDSPETGAIVARIPARRLGRPEEMAAAVEYFLSDGAGFTTGQSVGAMGG
jgi:3-oxoacyl-[acyl-carrier protein] reductase